MDCDPICSGCNDYCWEEANGWWENGCYECSYINMGCSISDCGAECEYNGDCGDYCGGSLTQIRYYNGVCDIRCAYCSCSWSSENCNQKASTGPSSYNHLVRQTVRDFHDCIMQSGSAVCDYTDYTDTCLAGNVVREYITNGNGYSTATYDCDNLDTAICQAGNVKRTEDWKCQNGACVQDSVSSYDCDLGDGYYCRGDMRQYYECTCRTDGTCGSSAGNAMCACGRGTADGGGGGWTECPNSNACSGACPGCLYNEYVCSGSTDCDDSVFCCDQSPSPGASCVLGGSYNPDTTQTRCTGCNQQWAVGSGDCTGEQCLTNCCGDDAGERYEQCENYAGSSMAWGCDSLDDACCNAYDCIDNNDNCLAGTSNSANYGSLTYLHGNLNPGGNDNYAFCYNGGNNPRWLDCDTGSWYNNWCANAQVCGVASGGVYAGEAGVGEYLGTSTLGCCGDDTSEFYNYFKVYPNNAAEGLGKYGGDDTSDDACCNDDSDCVYNGNCYSNGYHDLDGDGLTDMRCYIDSTLVPFDWWRNVDFRDSDCIALGYHWNVGGDAQVEDAYYSTVGNPPALCGIGPSGHPSQRCCCGDDSGENYMYFMTDYDESPDSSPSCNDVTDEDCVFGGDNTGDDACCDADNDCIYQSVCYPTGSYRDLNGDGRVDGWCMTSGSYKGHWRDCDDIEGNCNGACGADWAPGGETFQFGEYEVGTGTECCGDDPAEEYRTMECDGYVCTSDPNDKACCSEQDNCVAGAKCYDPNDLHPTLSGVRCNANGVWVDSGPPQTVIEPNGVWFDDQNETSFNLTCTDSGSGCSEIRYRIITPPQVSICQGGDMSDLTDRYTPGTQIPLTCLFGQVCDYLVCFASNDNAGNEEAMNISELFHLNTSACQGRDCGMRCLYTNGICDGPFGLCFDACSDRNLTGQVLTDCLAKDGCHMNCSIPWMTSNRFCYDEGARISCSNFEAACDRSGAYKCGSSPNTICLNSLNSEDCSVYGGAPTQITANWSSYIPPTGYYTDYYNFSINISGISSPTGFTVFIECRVNKTNDIGYVLFDNWDNGNGGSVNFTYEIQPSDPEGIWSIDRCDIWTDFWRNMGWRIKHNDTHYTFVVDKSPPNIIINTPPTGGTFYNNIVVNAAVTDTWSLVDSSRVYYRWENSTNNGTWEPMNPSGSDDYTETFYVSQVANGYYNITVNASDILGNEGTETVEDILIDREAPSITVFLPIPDWYNLDFQVKARAVDNQGISSVVYRWQNSTDVGSPQTMNPLGILEPDNYTARFNVNWVSSGNYTINVTAADGVGVSDSALVQNVGIDHLDPTSQMTQPSPNSYTMGTRFNISWMGSDNPAPPRGSDIDCYYVFYEYCSPSGCYGERNVNFPDNDCTRLAPPYEFNARDIGIQDLHNYTFFFKSRALDRAGNMEGDKPWETNITIFIPKLINFSVRENVTNRDLRLYGGRVPTNRTVVVEVQARQDVYDNLNIQICYYSDTLTAVPPDITDPSWDCSNSCSDTRSCNASIRILATEAQETIRVHYYLYAENASDTTTNEYLPPVGYFYYDVYYHPLCNFIIRDFMRTTLGSTELVAIQVRNIQDRFDTIGLNFSTGNARFIETNLPHIEILMNPGEIDKIIYARLAPSVNNFPLIMIGNSTVDPTLFDVDQIQVVIGFPADFSGLSDISIAILVLLAVIIYIKFVSGKRIGSG